MTTVSDQPFNDLPMALATLPKEDYDDFGIGVLTRAYESLSDDEEESESDRVDKKILARYRSKYYTSIEQTWLAVEDLYQVGKYDRALAVFEKGHDKGSGAHFLLHKEFEQRTRIKAQICLKKMTNTSDLVETYNEVVEDLHCAIELRGRAQEEMQDFLWRVLNTRVSQLIPRGLCDYKSIQTHQLVEAGHVWLTWFQLWSDNHLTLAGDFPSEQQLPHECLQRVGSELANRNELEECRKLMQRAVSVVPWAENGAIWVHIYVGIQAECAEALFDMQAANASYHKIQQFQSQYNKTFCYDIEGSGYTKCTLPGSLEERVERTERDEKDYWTLDDIVLGENRAEI